jgi:hypothetical protein
LAFIWRSAWCSAISALLVIPIAVGLCHVLQVDGFLRPRPGRPNLTFTGTAVDDLPWYVGAIVLSICLGLTGIQYIGSRFMIPVQLVLYWLAMQVVGREYRSNGRPLGPQLLGVDLGLCRLDHSGDSSVRRHHHRLGVGLYRQTRWMCRNIEGTRRESCSTRTGLGDAVAHRAVHRWGCMLADSDSVGGAGTCAGTYRRSRWSNAAPI